MTDEASGGFRVVGETPKVAFNQFLKTMSDHQKPVKHDDEMPIIVHYTREEAIADGVLTPTGFAVTDTGDRVNVTFTTHLFEAFQDHEKRSALSREGLAALAKPDPEDGGSRLRVLRERTIWVIWDGDGITFLYPDDY